MKKVTMNTVKSFVKKNFQNLEIKVNSTFDGMQDCVMPTKNAKFSKVTSTNDNLKNTLGINGAWFVGGGRDTLTPSYENDNTLSFIEVTNACGSFILRLVPETPKKENKSSGVQFEIKTPAKNPKKDLKFIPGTERIQSKKENKSNTPKPKSEKPQTKSKFTRFDAVGVVLKKISQQNSPDKSGNVSISLNNLIEQSDNAYYKQGGKLNPKEAHYAATKSIAALKAVELINQEKDIIIFQAKMF